MPITLFAREQYVNSDVVLDNAARNMVTVVKTGHTSNATSTSERRGTTRRLLRSTGTTAEAERVGEDQPPSDSEQNAEDVPMPTPEPNVSRPAEEAKVSRPLAKKRAKRQTKAGEAIALVEREGTVSISGRDHQTGDGSCDPVGLCWFSSCNFFLFLISYVLP
jgi:hypothetical protein